MVIRTSRTAVVKKTRWHDGNYIGDVMLAITPDDEAKLLPLVGKIVQIDTTFTVIGDQAALASSIPKEEVPSRPFEPQSDTDTGFSVGGSGSPDDDEEEEEMPAWFKNWLQGGMKR